MLDIRDMNTEDGFFFAKETKERRENLKKRGDGIQF